MRKTKKIALSVSTVVMSCIVLNGSLFLASAWTSFNGSNNGTVMAAASVSSVNDDNGNVIQTSVKNEESAMITINFVRLDKTTDTEVSLGTAVLKDGVLDVSGVTDQVLLEVLNKPFNTSKPRMADGKILEEVVTYQPGTVEHLQGIAYDLTLERKLNFIPKITRSKE
ncbi:MAG: hypothetical protein WBE75_03425 [Candidatus Omnitrophota bacterium]